METIRKFIDMVLHLDKSLDQLVQNYGPWVYAIIFLIVFAETGLVVTPFLPGDSLLFAIGALCADLKIPALRSYGINESHAPELARKALNSSSMKANPIALDESAMRTVLLAAL